MDGKEGGTTMSKMGALHARSFLGHFEGRDPRAPAVIVRPHTEQTNVRGPKTVGTVEIESNASDGSFAMMGSIGID